MKARLGTLVLIDEVLLYAKIKAGSDPGWLDILTSFFQYLTQAAAKVDRCCVVASLLSSEPKDQADGLGKKIVSDLYDIFQRQREEAVQPVEKDDVAEVLRRRLFNPKSVSDRDKWPQQVIAALKGIAALDEQTAKQGAVAEDRYLKSFPFHPELTEVFYAKWSAGIERFQKTRGVLRTFALALREAQKWDESPLVGPAVFLSPPGQEGLSEAARELVSVADTIISDGHGVWTLHPETDPAEMDHWLKDKAELVEEIQQLEHELDEVKKQQQATPTHLSWETLPEEAKCASLAPGRKRLLDTVKMIAYRAETALAAIVREVLSRADDARSLLRDLFTRTADLLPDEATGTLCVRVHASSNPRHDRAIAHLLGQATAAEHTYPGTKLKLIYALAGTPPNQNPGSQLFPGDQEV